MKQIVRDSKNEIFKLHNSYIEIKYSIKKMEAALKKASRNEVDSPIIETLETNLKQYKKYEKEISSKIDEYKTKVIASNTRIQLLQSKAEALKAMLNIRKTLSPLNSDSDLEVLNEMEEKITKMEMQVEAYDELESIL